MAHLNKDRSKTVYDNYDEYVNAQDARSHDYDCPNCLEINKKNLETFQKLTGYLPAKMLDIGCRDAGWFPFFGSKGIQCTGVDISPKSVKYAKSMGRDVRLVDASNLLDVVDEEYDFILSNHSFEHILNPLEMLQSCHKVLSSDGYMVVRLPDEKGVVGDVKNFAHVEAFKEHRLVSLFKKAGFVLNHNIRVDGHDWFFVLQKGTPHMSASISDFPLYQSPGDFWEKEFKRVMEDSFIQKKYNRERRINDKVEYIDKFIPEIKEKHGIVLDIGPGPGEFLEVCRHYGNEVEGIDASIGNSLMGNPYLTLSKLMTLRQHLKIAYSDFLVKLSSGFDYKDNSLICINSQGSIEQAFNIFMKGTNPPHEWSWVEGAPVQRGFYNLMDEASRVLMPGGIVFIYANGSGNDAYYDDMIKRSVKQAKGLEIAHTDNKHIHKIKKDG